MALAQRSGRSGQSGSGVNLNLVITPMLDMTFQLLFFFVLTFRPQSALEGRLDFSLPAVPEPRGEEVTTVISEPRLEEPPDLPQKLTVVVKTTRDGVHDGNIKELILEAEGGAQVVANVDTLRQALEARRPEPGKSQIKIAADSRLKYACIMEVMDACVRSGFTNVGFVPPPDLQ
jgi:biopolymer transport protein ExbD